MGSSLLRRILSAACRSLSLAHTDRGASVSAATRSLTLLRSLVAIASAARFDLIAARAALFFAGFERFAALRFFAMLPSPRAKHVRQIAHRRSRIPCATQR